MDEERLRRVVDALLQPERDMRVADLAIAVREKMAAGADERAAVLAVAKQLGATDPAAIERAFDGPPVPSGRLWAAAVSFVLSLAVLNTLYFVGPRFKQVFDAVDVPMPGMTVLFMALSDVVHDWWPLVLILVVAEGIHLFRSLRRSANWLTVRTTVVVALFLWQFPALLMPLLSLLQGIGKQK